MRVHILAIRCLNVYEFTIFELDVIDRQFKQTYLDFLNTYSISKVHLIFSMVGDDSWVSYKPTSFQEVDIFPKDGNKLYVLASLNNKPVQVSDVDEDFIKAQYISAYILIDENYYKQPEAASIIKDMDDFFLTRLCLSAISRKDKAYALNQLRFAVKSPAGRFLEGYASKKIFNSLYANVFDILGLLMIDTKAVFYPFHPDAPFDSDWTYRISINGNFKADKDTCIPFKIFDWDTYAISLSAKVKLFGTLHLGGFSKSKEYLEYDLPPTIETYTHRELFLIRHGEFENKRMYIKAKKETLCVLKKFNVVTKTQHGFLLDLTSIPMLTSAYTDLVDYNPFESLQYIYRNKSEYLILKKVRDTFDNQDRETIFGNMYKSLNYEQKKFLLGYRICEFGFYYMEPHIARNYRSRLCLIIVNRQKYMEKMEYVINNHFSIKKVYTSTEIKDVLETINKDVMRQFDYLKRKNQMDFVSRIEKKIDKILIGVNNKNYFLQCIRFSLHTSLLGQLFENKYIGFDCQYEERVFLKKKDYA